VFRSGWSAEAAEYKPAVIAGTWLQMESLLEQKIESLTHALIVLTRSEGSLLTMQQRLRLWQAFRVPVFEQIIGANGALLAAECEAHAGLHIESPSSKFAGWSIESGPCGCGRTAARIGVEDEAGKLRATAASAR
jgi:hypothetical protein